MYRFLFFIFFFPFFVFGQSSDVNYVKSVRYKEARTSSLSSPSVSQASVEVQYFDGLGRVIQHVSHRGSGRGLDLITPYQYDGLGRLVKEYLPYERTSPSESIDTNPISSLLSFYSSEVSDATSSPFSEVLHERSPLGRVIKSASPGESWKMGSGHEQEIVYTGNKASEVYHFKVNTNGTEPSVSYMGWYPAQQLHKTVVKEEDWTASDGRLHTSEVFMNKNQQKILERRYVLEANSVVPVDTYYLYNVYGDLIYVFSPKLSAAIVKNGALVSGYPALIAELGFTFSYDYRGRLATRRFPGAQTEKFVYDALDRLVASGPYPSPFLGETAVGWIHTKYDALNRPAYSLWVAGANCSLSENYYLSGNYDVSESRSSGRSINGVSVGYTNSVAPASGEVLQVYYYDDYHYPDAPSSIPSTIKGQAVFFNKTNAPKGLPTSTWTRVLEARSKKRGEQTAFLYDVNQRVIAELTTHYQGGSTDVHSLFDFAGNVLETETLHKQNANAEVLSVSEAFSY